MSLNLCASCSLKIKLMLFESVNICQHQGLKCELPLSVWQMYCSYREDGTCIKGFSKNSWSSASVRFLMMDILLQIGHKPTVLQSSNINLKAFLQMRPLVWFFCVTVFCFWIFSSPKQRQVISRPLCLLSCVSISVNPVIFISISWPHSVPCSSLSVFHHSGSFAMCD